MVAVAVQLWRYLKVGQCAPAELSSALQQLDSLWLLGTEWNCLSVCLSHVHTVMETSGCVLQFLEGQS